ncbi:TonB-dependent siderophore receptor [Brasilonema octagenarum]|uniref:TonB-dependent siderophore receptor n=1 Tax=Brasilonema octagenarum UFV-OR1 TaxID=417115 RepID=A0ABX1MAI4_9CYAN|nr:TonB-dependent siderophore receptor [Brasilonema octagenarum]NMF64795.1 TonB-dependent siderophore receptor [Brasilonema octagenarum UFV-OR1]
MKRWQLKCGVHQWLAVGLSGCLSAVVVQSASAQVKLESRENSYQNAVAPTILGDKVNPSATLRVKQGVNQTTQSPVLSTASNSGANSNSKPTPTTKIPRLSEIQHPLRSARMLVQSPTPQTTPAEQIVQVSFVKANPTNKGLELVLQTSLAANLQLQNRTQVNSNTFIVDIPNAQLRSPDNSPFVFRSQKPIAGITEITVTNFDANTIRVTVIGSAAAPIVELYDSPKEGLIFSVASTASLAQQGQQPQTQRSPAQQPESQTQPTQPYSTGDEPIELVVTGEQDGYKVPNATTATKTDTPILYIPQSIQVIPATVLKDQLITRPREAVQNVSGVTPGSAGSQTAVGATLIFRGFAENAITSSTFVNGFRKYFGNRASDTANVEQLEILKGPASVLYGQGEPGGILNITTKQPLSTPYYAVDATIGSFDFYRPTLDISGPLNADKTIRYRLNAAYESSGSYVDFVESDQIFVAPVISFELGKNTTLTLEGEYFHVSKVEYLAGIPAVGSVIKSPFGEIPRSRYLDDPELDLDLARVALGYRLQHKFSDNWSIRNGFRAEFQNYEEGYVFAGSLQADNRTLNRSAGFDNSDSENYVLQTDVFGKIQTGSVKQDLLFGLELARNNLTLERFSIAVPPINIFNPNYSRPPLERQFTRNQNEPQNFIGVYAQDLISIGDNLKILLGGRFDYAAGSTNNQFSSGLPSEQEDSAFSPRVGIVYQPIQPVSLYASWTRSFQPSRPVQGNADGTPFKPTTGEQFEVGVKTEFFNGRLAATLAAYQLTKQNIVVTDPVNPRLSLQVGEQQSQGIEFDLAGQILPGWNIIASYSYIDSEFTEDPRPAFKGDEPSNVPRNSARLWTTYEIQTGSLKGLGFGAGLFFVGERQGDLPNTFALPSYVRADAAIYYRRNNLRVGLNFKNLSDVYYFESALSRTSVYPGAPFTVLGTVSVQF